MVDNILTFIGFILLCNPKFETMNLIMIDVFELYEIRFVLQVKFVHTTYSIINFSLNSSNVSANHFATVQTIRNTGSKIPPVEEELLKKKFGSRIRITQGEYSF